MGETPVPRWLRGTAVPAMIQNLTGFVNFVAAKVDRVAPLGIFETETHRAQRRSLR